MPIPLPADIRSLYLAGPMRGYKEFNFPAFHEATAVLRGYGHTVMSPAEHDESTGFDPTGDTLDDFDLLTAMKWDLHAVLDSDGVVVLPGWEDSIGVAHELNAAEAAGIPVFAYPSLNRVIVNRSVRGERRVVNPVTGGEKGTKRTQLGAVDPVSLMQVAEVAGFGAEKYERYNFLKGYEWSLSFDAMCRHMMAFWSGEDCDPESGLPHMAHAGWHCLTLLSFVRLHSDLDDRPK